jgi:hypothetical protein
MQRNKDQANARQFMHLLEVLRDKRSTTVSEGNHDTSTWSDFGVESITLSKLLANGIDLSGKVAYVGMDLDRGGEEKERKALICLRERHPGTRINTTVVPRMLRIVGVRCVEEMRKPAADLMRRAELEIEDRTRGVF